MKNNKYNWIIWFNHSWLHIQLHSQWESEQICNMYNNNVCGPHKRQELCLLCLGTHGVTSDLHACMSPGVVQSVLLTPYQANNNHGPLVDYPWQHIKHVHCQSWLWVKIIKDYWDKRQLKTLIRQRPFEIWNWVWILNILTSPKSETRKSSSTTQ